MHVEIFENLKKAVTEYDAEGARNWARRATEENIDPIEAIDVLTQAIRQIGEAFGRGNKQRFKLHMCPGRGLSSRCL